jgi:glycosyltransferase involved in cell wall biosynthesis
MTGFDPSQLKVDLPKKKYKILTLCDHPLSTSGVGVQAGLLFSGLLQTGKYKFVCLGGAQKHADYRIAQPTPDMIIKPVDGFGTKEQVRQLLLTERPDALFLFTDPRQFIWVWEMADEIRQICPIVYWHVWDNGPYPAFNKIWYDSTDLLNCLAWKTYELVEPHNKGKTHYIPHAFPKEIYYPMPEQEIKAISIEKFGDKADWFKVLWVNRNATRKLGADVISCFGDFLDALEKKHGHRKALMIMHTDPFDVEGANLVEVSNLYGLKDHVMFSTEKLAPKDMNLVHNLCDTLINIAKAEGFGLSPLIQMMTGKPIIALTTGGMTRQVIDHRDGTENGVAIPPASKQLVGSQLVPYIYEDFTNHQQVVDAFMKIYEMTPEQKDAMKKKVLEYVDYEFNYKNVISKWDETLEKCIKDFKIKRPKSWSIQEIKNPNPQPTTTTEQTEKILEQNKIVLEPEVKKLPIDITAFLMKNINITRFIGVTK